MRGREYAELRAFAAVAEEASFSRAARLLGLSPSALSQTLRGLEERLGVRLLNRTTRSVSMTPAGALLFGRVAPLLAAFDDAQTEVTRLRDTPAGPLRITVPRLAVHQFVVPLLDDFHRAYPAVELEIAVEDATTDIVAGGFDAGIRLGERLERDMVAVKLGGDLEMMAVAAPGYLAARGTPEKPADLQHHACIRYRWPSDGSLYRWEFEADGRPFEVAVDGPLIVNDTDLMLQAVQAGVGIGYLIDRQARPFVDDGTLTRVLQRWSPRFPGFYLYHSSRRQVRPALQAFIACVSGDEASRRRAGSVTTPDTAPGRPPPGRRGRAP